MAPAARAQLGRAEIRESAVYPDGKISLTNQCLVAGLGYGRDGSYSYYMSEPISKDDPKATAPFILAAVEVARLLDAGVAR